MLKDTKIGQWVELLCYVVIFADKIGSCERVEIAVWMIDQDCTERGSVWRRKD